MARSLEGRLNEEADKKGLEGEKRKQYIGGIWQHIRGVERRSHWRHSREGELLSKHFGIIDEIREREHDRGITFRKGNKFYHLPKAEYRNLVRAAEQDERDTQRAQALIARERAKDARSKATQSQKQERERARQERATKAAEDQQQKDLRRFEREQYSDVVKVLKQSGGIRPFKTEGAQGKKYMSSEYRDLPSTVKSSKGRLDMDHAAEAVREEMPWLKIDTSDDLVQFFDRHRTYGRRRTRHAA